MGKKLIGALVLGGMIFCVFPSFAGQKQKKGASVLRVRTTLVLVPAFVYDKRLVMEPNLKKFRQCNEENWKLFARLRPSQPYLGKSCRQGVAWGLTAKDFRLFQDGVEQRIESVTVEDWSMVVRDNMTWHNAFSLTPAGEWSTPDLWQDRFYPDPRAPLYLLTYVPPAGKPGSCHKIRVKVDRPGTFVLARDSYCVGQTPSDPLNGTKFGKKLAADLASGVPGKLQLSVQAGSFYGPNGKALVDIAMRVPWKSLHCSWNLSNWKLRATIGVLGEIRGNGGVVVARFSDLAYPSYWPTFVSGGGLLGPGGIVPQVELGPYNLHRLARREPGWVPNRYETQVSVPPGSYDLQVVMSDGKNFGRAAMPLVIHKPAGKLALSSIALCRRLRDAAAAGAEAAAGHFAPRYIPLVSKGVQVALSADTRFPKSEDLIAYFEVNDPLRATKAKTPLDVYMRVLDANAGKVVAEYLPVDARPYEEKRNAVVRIARVIPLKEFAAGKYQFEVRVANSADSTPWRMADFAVTAKNPASK